MIKYRALFLSLFFLNFSNIVNPSSEGSVDKVLTIQEENLFLKTLLDLNFYSATFTQKTFHDDKERRIEGNILANRTGKFKLTYTDPLNEIISYDGKILYRYDKDLEQLTIQPSESILKETPIGLFSLNIEELRDLFLLSECKKNLDNFSCLLVNKDKNSIIPEIKVNLRNKAIDSITFVDSFKQTVFMEFRDINTNQFPEKNLELIIEEGTDIVNLNKDIE
ncbi:MAG: LolA family protein [Gammaproteobacteria bacterium]